ncbi:cytochrome c [Frateuria hangzhouensis]|uniref:cytochrome c n=1 Tax=Frateuria hangzhouensis TaxID=2995589 RepID=UPI002260CE83|nr:cytochrome c [Frateuria sp. STR12]MCX7513524.1 cytochrome c [Frateuria sp. STR12]
MNARSALLILLGLVIGILGTVFAMKALGNRNPMPHAVMTVMGHHMGALGQAVKSGQCDAAQINDHLLRLQSTSGDIAAAFPSAEQDFLDHAGRLRNALQDAVQAHPTDCAALAKVTKPVGDSCKSCHQQYR